MFGRVMDMMRCLVVEECAEDRKTTVGLLQDLGFDVYGVGSEVEALQFCKSHFPAVILVGDSAGKRRTATTLIHLRAAVRHADRKPVILMCAGNHNAENIGLAVMNGADDCLVKPFAGTVLQRKINQFGLV